MSQYTLDEKGKVGLIFALALINKDITINHIRLPKANNTSIYNINHKNKLQITIAPGTNQDYDKILKKIITYSFKEHSSHKPKRKDLDKPLESVVSIAEGFREDIHSRCFSFNTDEMLATISDNITGIINSYKTANSLNNERLFLSIGATIASRIIDNNLTFTTEDIIETIQKCTEIEDSINKEQSKNFVNNGWQYLQSIPNSEDWETEKNYIKTIVYAYASNNVHANLINYPNLDNTLTINYFVNGSANTYTICFHNRETQLEDSKKTLHRLCYDMAKNHTEFNMQNSSNEQNEQLAVETISNNLDKKCLQLLAIKYLTQGVNNNNWGMDERLVGTSILTLKDILTIPHEKISVSILDKIINKNQIITLLNPETPSMVACQYLNIINHQQKLLDTQEGEFDEFLSV